MDYNMNKLIQPIIITYALDYGVIHDIEYHIDNYYSNYIQPKIYLSRTKFDENFGVHQLDRILSTQFFNEFMI